jgi:hypothetical protein
MSSSVPMRFAGTRCATSSALFARGDIHVGLEWARRDRRDDDIVGD